MNMTKFRWSKVYESSEEELKEFLRSRNLQAEQISEEGGGEQRQLQFSDGCTVWCAEGSLSLRADSKNISLQPGDALPIPAGQSFVLQPGMFGYVCYITR